MVVRVCELKKPKG